MRKNKISLSEYIAVLKGLELVLTAVYAASIVMAVRLLAILF